MYKIGKIINTHGIRGEVKIKSESDFERFKKGEIVQISDKPFTIKSVRMQNDVYLVSFENYPDLTSVEKLKGLYVYSDQEILIEDEDEFHYSDLIGKKVFTTSNKFVGIITDILEVPQGHILEIKNENKKNLVPFVDAFIDEIDEDVIIREIEGLLKWL